VGTPDNCPVVALNEAHAGMLAMENVSGCACASEAVGVKLYCVEACTAVSGVPVIAGAVFVGGGGGGANADETVMRNDASVAVAPLPSETLMVMSPVVPTSLSAGMPESAPVCTLKLAQAGRPVALKLNVSPLASLAPGRNE
jgi:hypothetical protein